MKLIHTFVFEGSPIESNEVSFCQSSQLEIRFAIGKPDPVMHCKIVWKEKSGVKEIRITKHQFSIIIDTDLKDRAIAIALAESAIAGGIVTDLAWSLFHKYVIMDDVHFKTLSQNFHDIEFYRGLGKA